jgi:hypothetical protein
MFEIVVAKMGTWKSGINTFLSAFVCLALVSGCETTGTSDSEGKTSAEKKGKIASTLRLHVETTPDPGMVRTRKISVLRAAPMAGCTDGANCRQRTDPD